MVDRIFGQPMTVLTRPLTVSYTPLMTQDQLVTYRTALKEAKSSFDQASKKLRENEDESSRLRRDIAKLRRTITALSAMCSEDPLIDSLGITDACMEVMEEQEITVTTANVVTWLEADGFDLASQKNAAASVHAVLTRLANRGKITKIKIEESDSDAVAWRGPNYDAEFDSFMKAK